LYSAVAFGSAACGAEFGPCQRELREPKGGEERQEVGEEEQKASKERSQVVTEGDEELEEASPVAILKTCFRSAAVRERRKKKNRLLVEKLGAARKA
jgi:hypothetical protein